MSEDSNGEIQRLERLEKKRLYERHLVDQLKEGSERLGIRFDEWDMDEFLCRALVRALYRNIRSNPTLKGIRDIFDKYDAFYKQASDLNINIDNKFIWFHQMCKNLKP